MNIALIAVAISTLVFQGEKAASKRAEKKDAGAPPAVYVIRAKHAETMGSATEHGVSIIVKDGKIVAMGPDVSVPEGAVQLEAEYVTPGLVDADSSAGRPGLGVEDTSEITPSFRAVENLDPTQRSFERLVKQGVTTIFAGPSNRNVVGGLGGVVKSAPASKPRVLNPSQIVKFAFGDEPQRGNFTLRGGFIRPSLHFRRPGSRPATVMEARMALFAAQRMAGKFGLVPPDFVPLVDLFEKEAPIRIHADSLTEIHSVLRVVREFGLRNVVIDGGEEAHRVTDELKSAGIRVVLHPFPIHPTGGVSGRGGNFDFGDERPAMDKLVRLAAAGIPVALSSYESPDDLITQARIAVRYGTPRELALRAVTRSAAEILGVDSAIGSIAVGKDADLVLWSGDPVEWTSSATAVLVDGQLAYRR